MRTTADKENINSREQQPIMNTGTLPRANHYCWLEYLTTTPLAWNRPLQIERSEAYKDPSLHSPLSDPVLGQLQLLHTAMHPDNTQIHACITHYVHACTPVLGKNNKLYEMRGRPSASNTHSIGPCYVYLRPFLLLKLYPIKRQQGHDLISTHADEQ